MNKQMIIFQCRECSSVATSKMTHCHKCGSQNIEEKTLTESGEIYTFTIVRATYGQWKDKVPYVLATVRVPPNIQFSTIIETETFDKIKIGTKVLFSHFMEKVGPIFKLAD